MTRVPVPWRPNCFIPCEFRILPGTANHKRIKSCTDEVEGKDFHEQGVRQPRPSFVREKRDQGFFFKGLGEELLLMFGAKFGDSEQFPVL